MPAQEAVESLLGWYRSRMLHPSYWRGQLKQDLAEGGYELSEADLDDMLASACKRQNVWNPTREQHLSNPVRIIVGLWREG